MKMNQFLKQLFKGAELKQLQDLDNTLKFAYGELSRLGGLPGGVFIQLNKQVLQHNYYN